MNFGNHIYMPVKMYAFFKNLTICKYTGMKNKLMKYSGHVMKPINTAPKKINLKRRRYNALMKKKHIDEKDNGINVVITLQIILLLANTLNHMH